MIRPRAVALTIHRRLAASPLAGMLEWAPMRALQSKWRPRLGGQQVLALIGAVDAAGAAPWLVGGWGVDALLGVESRAHEDVDIAVDPDRFAEDAVVAALSELGFCLSDADAPRSPWTRRLLIFENEQGAGVDVILPGTADEIATGEIDGTPVRCLSARAQIDAHHGYESQLRAVDHLDVAALCARFDLPRPAWLAPPAPLGPVGPTIKVRAMARRAVLAAAARLGRPMAESAIVVALPAVDAAMADLRRHHRLPEPHAPAHVTVLAPLPAGRRVASALAELAACQSPFTVRLAWLGRFPGVLYLSPEPVDRFVALTRAAWSRWPTYPPYGGQFRTIVPHVTVARVDWPQAIETELSAVLPITAPVEELWLVNRRPGRAWHVVARHRLGAV